MRPAQDLLFDADAAATEELVRMLRRIITVGVLEGRMLVPDTRPTYLVRTQTGDLVKARLSA